MKLTVTDSPNPADDDYVAAQTRRYNSQFMESGFQLVSCYFHNSEDEIIGGLTAKIFWSWLHIEYLWVSESERGNDLGSKLMKAAEKEAIDKGCVGSQLDTFSFQALGFYKKLGYSVMGSLSGYSNNAERVYLYKKFK